MMDDNEFLENQNELYAFSNHETRLINTLNKRIQELESALREISEHPHCRYEEIPVSTGSFDYKTGMAEAHLFCAEIARKALDK